MIWQKASANSATSAKDMDTIRIIVPATPIRPDDTKDGANGCHQGSLQLDTSPVGDNAEEKGKGKLCYACK